MSYAALVRAMSAAGAPPEAIALALEAIEQRDADDEARRTHAREKKRRQRASVAGTVPGPSRDMAGTVPPEPAPSPPPLLSPQTPQTTPPPHPHPDGLDAHARGLVAELVLGLIVAGCRDLIEQQAATKRRWPKTMPPPAGVSDEQWAEFIDHRVAKRERLTQRAYELLCRKLAEFAENGWPPGAEIDRAVERGWLTVFPPDETRNGQRSHNDRSRSRGLLGAVFDAERDDRAGASL